MSNKYIYISTDTTYDPKRLDVTQNQSVPLRITNKRTLQIYTD